MARRGTIFRDTARRIRHVFWRNGARPNRTWLPSSVAGAMNRAPTVMILKLFILIMLGGVMSHCAHAEQFEYDSKGKRDPFFSAMELVGETVDYKALKLEGIILDVGGAHAVINSEILQEGDSIAGFTIRTIEENRVVLQKDENTFDLLLRRDDEEETSAMNPAEDPQAYEFEAPPVEGGS